MNSLLRRLGLRRPDGAATRAGRFALLLTLVMVTGFYNNFSHSWSLAFRLNLIIHPLLGLFVTTEMLRSIFGRLRSKIPALTPSVAVAFLALFLLALVRAFTFEHFDIHASNDLAGKLTVLLALAGIYFGAKMARALPQIPRDRTSWQLIVLVCLWTLSATLGLAIFGYRGPSSKVAFHLHSFIGNFSTLFGFLAVLPRRGTPARRAFWSGLVAGVAVLLVAATTANFVGERLRGHDVPAPFGIRVGPVDRQVHEPQDYASTPPTAEASWLEIVESCGGSGCHDSEIAEFRRSLHAISLRPPHVAKVLAELTGELGPASEQLCTGCHAPAARLVGGPSIEATARGDAFGCVFCHSVTQVKVGAEHEASEIQVALNAAHLAPFREAEQRGQPLSGLARLSIQLNPTAHAKVFKRALYQHDDFCMGCHSPLKAVRHDQATCVECHMPPSARLGLRGSTRNHSFVGSNTATFEVLGDHETAALNEAWTRSDLLVRELKDLYVPADAGPVEVGDGRLGSFYYLGVDARFATPPVPGGTAALDVVSRNLSIPHAFPSSSLDILEAWLEVEVNDAGGRGIFRSGGVDADGRVLAESRRLGGYMHDAAGRPIEHYRVWAAADAGLTAYLPPEGSHSERFSFAVPADAERHLVVTTRLRYRKLGHAFWRWAYGDRPIPTLLVAENVGVHALQRDEARSSTDR